MDSVNAESFESLLPLIEKMDALLPVRKSHYPRPKPHMEEPHRVIGQR